MVLQVRDMIGPPKTSVGDDPLKERQYSGTTKDPSKDPKEIVVTAPAKKFTINTFRTEIAGRGVLPNHSFVLLLDGSFFSGQSSSKAYEHQNRMIAMRCETITIPGINFMLQDVTKFGYGPISRMPHAAQYNMITANFIMDENAAIYKFFKDWAERIIPHNSFGGRAMREPNKNGMKPYQVAYKSTYAIPQMTLLIADRRNASVVEIKFFDVYPTVINDINMAWGDMDTAMKLSVTMSFTDAEYMFSYLDEGPLATSDFDPSNEETPAQKKKKKSILSRLSSKVGKAAGRAIVDGLIEETERKVYKIVDDIF